MRDQEKLCSNCCWNRLDWTAWKDDKQYFCGNTESDNHGVPTFFDDSCPDWEPKE